MRVQHERSVIVALYVTLVSPLGIPSKGRQAATTTQPLPAPVLVSSTAGGQVLASSPGAHPPAPLYIAAGDRKWMVWSEGQIAGGGGSIQRTSAVTPDASYFLRRLAAGTVLKSTLPCTWKVSEIRSRLLHERKKWIPLKYITLIIFNAPFCVIICCGGRLPAALVVLCCWLLLLLDLDFLFGVSSL